jgi:hypothetical protein
MNLLQNLNSQRFCFILTINCLFTVSVFSQDKWVYNGQFNLGCNINFTYGKGQTFPGFRIFGAVSLNGVYDEHVMINYSPSIAIYTKSIGANLNPLVDDFQIDFTNSFSLGGAWAGSVNYYKYFRTIHSGDYYNVSINKENAVLFTSNFILNNHKRNQVVGSISANFGNVTLNYGNDGAIPFNWIAIADNFDRWWTGSGGIFIHNRKGYNDVEITYDQFTGYTPLLYELSHMLGINVPLYSENDTTKKGWKRPYTFNTSSYNVKVFLDRNYAVNTGFVGSLKHKGFYYGMQDLIHIGLKYPLHPNNDNTRFYIGPSYTNFQDAKF